MIDTSKLSETELAIYTKLITKLPAVIAESDYATFVALLAILIDAVDNNIAEFHRQLNVQTADEQYLRLLAEVVGYTWLENFTVEANRARLMAYEYRRKYRGTLNAIKNLARASIDEESFYSNAENKNIKVYEGSENPYEPNVPGHVITLELPDSFEIVRLDIEEVRPAGTVLWFVYKILLELIEPNFDNLTNLGSIKLKLMFASFVDETLAGDAPSVDPKLFPTWGYDVTFGERWDRPLVLYSTYPGISKNSNNEYEIDVTKSKTTLNGFTYLYVGTDWISDYLNNQDPVPDEGIYSIIIEDGSIISYAEIIGS